VSTDGDSSRRPCKLCGMPIAFAKHSGSGRMVPLSHVRTVFVMRDDGRVEPLELPKGRRVAVSHFETCPNVGKNRGRGSQRKS